MLESFKLSFVLRNTYRTNSIIYTIKSLPILRQKLKGTLYANRNIKTLANILSIQGEIISIFLYKILYVILMAVIPLNFMQVPKADGFVHIMLFLTVLGGILNAQMFTASKDKYYAIFLMRMEAKKYTLSNYFYFLFKVAIGLLPVVLITGMSYGVDPVTCLLIPLFAVGIKCSMVPVLILKDADKKATPLRKRLSMVASGTVIIILLAVTYLPVCFGYTVPYAVFYIGFGAVVIGAVWGVRYMLRYQAYKRTWKDVFAEDSMMHSDKIVEGRILQTNYQKKLDVTQTSHKSGYEYFNELFIKRHNSILTKSANRITLILLVILAASLAACIFIPDVKRDINKMIMTSLPLFLFVMYFINRGQVVTQAMFMNCDHSMLTYRFYRQPKVILHLFAVRLKSVIRINLIPAVVIALGLPFLLWFTGGTDTPVNYIMLSISIIAMSVFFSVHYMVLYYLLQPYNKEIEIKSTAYTVLNWLTYYFCYVIMSKKMSTLVFGGMISAFCVLYIIIALILAYRFASKTFKLRL